MKPLILDFEIVAHLKNKVGGHEIYVANEGLYAACCSIKTDSFVVVAYPTIITPGLTSKDDWCLHAGDYFVVAATLLQGDKKYGK